MLCVFLCICIRFFVRNQRKRRLNAAQRADVVQTHNIVKQPQQTQTTSIDYVKPQMQQMQEPFNSMQQFNPGMVPTSQVSYDPQNPNPDE